MDAQDEGIYNIFYNFFTCFIVCILLKKCATPTIVMVPLFCFNRFLTKVLLILNAYARNETYIEILVKVSIFNCKKN